MQIKDNIHSEDNLLQQHAQAALSDEQIDTVLAKVARQNGIGKLSISYAQGRVIARAILTASQQPAAAPADSGSVHDKAAILDALRVAYSQGYDNGKEDGKGDTGCSRYRPQAVVHKLAESVMQVITAAPAIQQEGAALIGDLPQPFAGAITLLETIATHGAQAAFEDGTATPNAKLCVRFARALRDYAASQQPAAAPTAPAVQMQDERAAFEAWADNAGHPFDSTEDAFGIWQAALASQASKGAGVPEAAQQNGGLVRAALIDLLSAIVKGGA